MSGISLHVPNVDTGKFYTSQAAEEAVQAKTGRGILHSLFIANGGAATSYIYVFDNTASSGTVLAGPFAVPADSEIGVDFRYGLPFETGLRVAASSTMLTFGALGANELRYMVGYGPNSKRKDQVN